MMLTFREQPPEVRRTLARLRARRMEMRRLGIGLAVDGARVTPAARTDVRETWKRAGWRPTKAGRKAA